MLLSKADRSLIKFSVLDNRGPVGFFSQQKGLRQVSHLLYADDTLIFYRAERSKVLYLNLTLQLFEALSGLHINMSKSNVYPVNNVPNLEELTEILCCGTTSLPTTYLGLSLGTKNKSLEVWNGVVEKFKNKLASWKRQYLYMGGRLTLINSVLDSIPTYLNVPCPNSKQGGQAIR
ncbi:uncharacterized protein LOC142168065 [Nicotiana tabacum]|uniref:Uncharacterized protein LOC142168065 n=1 Tax=Nicotiana tabacum TaxID=4097 RepID=A0AC58SIN2_TOBAC